MTNEQIAFLKQNYQPGIRIRLISMAQEPQMPAGLIGIVDFVDDIGQIHTRWSNGSTLALNCEVDEFVAFSGPEACEYLRKYFDNSGGAKVWYRTIPNRYYIESVDYAALIAAAESYIEKNIAQTEDLAVITCEPYDTTVLLDAFISAHVLSDEAAHRIQQKKDYTATESDQYHCPKCGSDKLDYGQTKLEDNFVVCKWKCRVCGSAGKEYGSIVFDGHTVETQPESVEVQP